MCAVAAEIGGERGDSRERSEGVVTRRRAVHVFHREVADRAACARRVHVKDVRVVQLGDEVRFGGEVFQVIGKFSRHASR